MTPIPSFDGSAHNAMHPVVCSTCLPHEHQTKLNSLEIPATVAQASGPLIQLCKECIRDEMELYWARYGRAKPTGHHTAPSLADIVAWPTRPDPDDVQNLCICAVRAVGRFANTCCHQCRNNAFTNFHEGCYQTVETILRDHTKALITGERLCTLNGGTTPNRVRDRDLQARLAAGIGRMCPCGKRPQVQAQWISICLACMGVRVDARHIPKKYSQAEIVTA